MSFHVGLTGILSDISEQRQMMKQLNLTEGDPVSVRGVKLPKGKMVKLQAQTVDFLEVADPKAAYVRLPLIGSLFS